MAVLFIGCILGFGLIACRPARRESDVHQAPIQRIAFGSCLHQDRPQPIWQAVLAARPEAFIFLGDNIYGDTRNMDSLRACYLRLGAQHGFQQLRATTAVFATWDDHDYGENDAGASYPYATQSRDIFLDFWAEPHNSRRRTHTGIYHDTIIGPADKAVQIILLDLRTFRSPQNKTTEPVAENMGRYIPDTTTAAHMLGEAQWQWLAAALRKPAALRLVCSSTQFVAEFNGWEAWANYPNEKKRLLELIRTTKANGVVFLSGDTHWAELSQMPNDPAYPIIDLTSSGMTETWPNIGPNQYRIGNPYPKNNFGLLTIDWQAQHPNITLEIRDSTGTTHIHHHIKGSELQMQ